MSGLIEAETGSETKVKTELKSSSVDEACIKYAAKIAAVRKRMDSLKKKRWEVIDHRCKIKQSTIEHRSELLRECDDMVMMISDEIYKYWGKETKYMDAVPEIEKIDTRITTLLDLKSTLTVSLNAAPEIQQIAALEAAITFKIGLCDDEIYKLRSCAKEKFGIEEFLTKKQALMHNILYSDADPNTVIYSIITECSSDPNHDKQLFDERISKLESNSGNTLGTAVNFITSFATGFTTGFTTGFATGAMEKVKE